MFAYSITDRIESLDSRLLLISTIDDTNETLSYSHVHVM